MLKTSVHVMAVCILMLGVSQECLAQSSAPTFEEVNQVLRQIRPSLPVISTKYTAKQSLSDDEPLVSEWVAKDIEAAKWIAKLMPVEKQSFRSLRSILKVDKPSEDEWYGFGARRFYIGHGNGYTSVYADVFTFKGKIGYYQVGVKSHSKEWSQIKEKVIKAWEDSGGPKFTEDEHGISYSQIFGEFSMNTGKRSDSTWVK